MLEYATVECDWGVAGFVCSGQGLCGLLLPESGVTAVRRWVQHTWPDARFNPRLAPSLQLAIRAYFAGRHVAFSIRVDLDAMSPFQRAVLQACRRIPYGQRVTYGELARRVGRPRAARAVGGVMARNPIPLVIPCHRVIAGDGSLGGFSARRGVAVKKRMLAMEDAGSCVPAGRRTER